MVICSSMFTNPTIYSITGSNAVTIADINIDGKLDIIAVTYGKFHGDIVVLFNAGNGTFLNETKYLLNNIPYGVIVADLNNDKAPDLIVGLRANLNILIFLNSGNGKFMKEVAYAVDTHASSILIMDVNNNDKPDLAIGGSHPSATKVCTLLNLGDGTFRELD
ncbi:hypothetical protein I4U23_006478 [Adineta vaga]|nr:hypothetical protein I4U23_006478 [Adineta vaga]